MKWSILIIILFSKWTTLSMAHCTRKLHTADWYECSNMSSEKLRHDLRIAHRYSFFTKLNIANIDLQNLNEELFTDVVQVPVISIIKCNVTNISINTFNSKLDLKHLEITDNNIEVIKDDVFHGHNLMTVILADNNIRNISGICSSARYIQEIYLNNNYLSRVDSFQFYCSKLRILNLNNNLIEFISSDAFKELHALYSLDLSCNKLKNIEFLFSFDPNSNANGFFNSVQISGNAHIKINASNNNIMSLNMDYITKNMSNLKHLYLDNNNISNIVAKDSAQNKLSLLSLRNNQISLLTNNTFKSCTSYLTNLDLSKNPLEKIEPGVFSFKNDVHLNLSESLQSLNFSDLKLFKDSCKISNLQIDNCNITNLKSDSFKSCHSLINLNLSGNNISSIEPGTFRNLGSVMNLHPKTFFSNVTQLRYKQFTGLTLIKELDLSNLRIRSLENNTFADMTFLKKINLSNNNIEILVTETFYNLKLDHIDLSNSSIKTIHPKAFSKLPELSILILNFNKIKNFSRKFFDDVKNLEYLDLSFNKIEAITSGTFEFLPKLINIYLNDNNIMLLESYSFYRLSKLNHLNLKNNAVEDIEPHTFEGISDEVRIDYFNTFSQKVLKSRGFEGLNFKYLDNLNFSYSSFEVIEKEAFYGLTQLQTINLQNCNISKINSRAFADVIVEELNLSYNNITYLDDEAFFGLSVQNLTLNKNNFGVLSQKLFSSLTLDTSKTCCRLEWLYLSNAGVTEVQPYSFKLLNDLIHLDLSYNKIILLKSNSFDGLNNLQSLSLENNPILNIENSAFRGLRKLISLVISHNDIPLINSSILDYLSNLDQFSLRNSEITVISPKTFQHMRLLKTLDLSYNIITDLQNSAFSELNIDTLDLNSCRFRNNTITPNIFIGLHKLQTLYLYNCSFTILHANSFIGLDNLSHLHLENNKIRELNMSIFDGLDKLSNLYLQKNRIKQISCNSFYRLNNLKVINLSKNQINNIEVCGFQYFSQLTHLYLESNRISALRVGTFAALDSIIYLNLSHNILKDFNPFVFYNMPMLEYLDISANSIYTRSFLHIFKFNSTVSHMENLKYLGLTDNEFPCNNLMDFLKFMKLRNIVYKPIGDYEYNTTNIDGIACTLK